MLKGHLTGMEAGYVHTTRLFRFQRPCPSWPPETQKSYQLVSVSQTIGLASFIDLEHSSCRNIEQREQEPYMR